jgi:hypothetical protein
MACGAGVEVTVGVWVSAGARVNVVVGGSAVAVAGWLVCVGAGSVGVKVPVESADSGANTGWVAAGVQPSKHNTILTNSNLRSISLNFPKMESITVKAGKSYGKITIL